MKIANNISCVMRRRASQRQSPPHHPHRTGQHYFSAAAAVLALALAGLLPGQTSRAAELSAQPGSRPTEWAISYGGKRVMTYAFDPQKYKPYVKELNTLNDYGVLRDSPGDHLHHHSLMYGINVNGLNFWEETAGCGVQKVVETRAPQLLRDAGGLPQASLVQVLYWLAPEDAFLPNSNAPALLIERRTLTLTLNPESKETALHWKSEFEVGRKTNVVTLTGFNYHGLGMRFLKELDPLAVHLAPAGPLNLSGSQQIVSPYPWVAVTFDQPGKPATMALFGSPANARGNPTFFTMKEPFAYMSATQGLDKEPLVYRRGEHFELNYLVVVYPEIKSAETLTQRGLKWTSSNQK